MKVFLSHSTKDKHFAQAVAARLKSAGYEAWICDVDIDSFQNFVAEIEKGLQQSDLTLLIWSPDAANSAWTEQEWTSALARQIAESRIRIGVVSVREHPLPQLLRMVNYIDASRDPDGAIQRVVEWVERRRNIGRLSGQTERILIEGYRPSGFAGREAYLARLHTALVEEPTTFLLHGEPGKGKTMLALQFAWNSRKDFDCVVFRTCGERTVDEIGAELADSLGLDVTTSMAVLFRLPLR
jgi:hypothetical protein